MSDDLTDQEAKSLAEEVRAAASALTNAISRAASRGLIVEVRELPISRCGSRGREQLFTATITRPV